MAVHKLEEMILAKFTRDPGADNTPVFRDDYGAGQELSILTEVFPDFLDCIRDKKVVDFGCGLGYQTAALAEAGAKQVLGIEITEKSRLNAEQLIRERKLEHKVKISQSIDPDDLGTFDIVISQNSMEHFSEPAKILELMKSALNQRGQLFVTFGPPWFAPTGSHMNYFINIPWANILFSEKAIMNVRKKFRSDGASRYEDVESGLNKMSVSKFERLIARCGIIMKYRKYDCVKKLDILGKIPLLRELFINRINCILVKDEKRK